MERGVYWDTNGRCGSCQCFYVQARLSNDEQFQVVVDALAEKLRITAEPEVSDLFEGFLSQCRSCNSVDEARRVLQKKLNRRSYAPGAIRTAVIDDDPAQRLREQQQSLDRSRSPTPNTGNSPSTISSPTWDPPGTRRLPSSGSYGSGLSGFTSEIQRGGRSGKSLTDFTDSPRSTDLESESSLSGIQLSTRDPMNLSVSDRFSEASGDEWSRDPGRGSFRSRNGGEKDPSMSPVLTAVDAEVELDKVSPGVLFPKMPRAPESMGCGGPPTPRTASTVKPPGSSHRVSTHTVRKAERNYTPESEL